MKERHKSIIILQGDDIRFIAIGINKPGTVDWAMIQSCFSQHFMVVLKKQDGYDGFMRFYSMVMLIGTSMQAEKFAYRLELKANQHHLTWEDKPCSIRDGVEIAIINNHCLVFDEPTAYLFTDDNNLEINVTISIRDEDQQTPNGNGNYADFIDLTI